MMLAKTYGVVAAAITISVNAFMLDSTIDLSQSAKTGNPGLLWTETSAFSNVVVTLPCRECSLEGRQQSDLPSLLALEFKVSPDGESLLLNDKVVPIGSYTKDDENRIEILQTVNRAEAGTVEDWEKDIERELTYSSTTDYELSEEGIDLVHMTFNFNLVGQEDVALQQVTLRMIQNAESKIQLVDVSILTSIIDDSEKGTIRIMPIEETMDDSEISREDCPDDSTPAALACQMKQFMREKLASFRRPASTKRPCPYKQSQKEEEDEFMPPMPHHAGGPPMIKGGPAKFWGKPHNHEFEGRPHHHHHHHHRGSRAMHFIRQFVPGFVFPALVGYLIVWVWIRIARRGKRGSESRRVIVVEDVEQQDAEKMGLLAVEESTVVSAEEALPVYVEKE